MIKQRTAFGTEQYPIWRPCGRRQPLKSIMLISLIHVPVLNQSNGQSVDKLDCRWVLSGICGKVDTQPEVEE
jgi:hypothetical protein